VPTAASRLCPKCRGLIAAGRSCPTCKRNVDIRRGSSTKRGYDFRWQRRRAWGLRKEPFCRIHLEVLGKFVRATSRDHIVLKAGAETMMKAIFKAYVDPATAPRVTETMKSLGVRWRLTVGSRRVRTAVRTSIVGHMCKRDDASLAGVAKFMGDPCRLDRLCVSRATPHFENCVSD
jgi:hypothetical protein